MRRAIVVAVLVAFFADGAMADEPPVWPTLVRPAKPLVKPVKVTKKVRVVRAPAPVPLPPPIPMPPIQRWVGPYAGGNIGGGWAFTHSSFSSGGVPFASVVNNLGGLNGGFQLGHNWQSDRTVFGFEADIQLTGQSGGIDAPTCPALVCGVATSASYREKLAWFGTVRGRMGYASDFWLAYVTGGYAYGRLAMEATATAGATTATAMANDLRSGWTAGGGLEVALDPRWSVKMEYLYMDLGRRDLSWTFTGLPTIDDSIKLRQNVVRAGLNLRF